MHTATFIWLLGEAKSIGWGKSRDTIRSMKFLLILTFAALGLWVMQAQAEPGVHQGQYQKNLTYKGPVTEDEIIYTLYLPPGHAKDKGPYPLIVFLHGAMPLPMDEKLHGSSLRLGTFTRRNRWYQTV